MKSLRILLLAALSAAPLMLVAGTPLICHPYEIGGAKSLPAGEWKGADPKYDRSNLVPDTLALLTPETPIIVRMETLRRAAIYATGSARGWTGEAYAADDRPIVRALVEKLQARVDQAPEGSRDFAQFDLGFFAETLRHTRIDVGIDGYALLAQIADARPDDADVQFALALATSWPRQKASQAEHLAKARAKAKKGTLVAANLATHFGHQP